MPKPKPKSAPEPSFSPATLPADHRLVRLGPPQGSNQFLAEDAEGVESLVDMPAKIRRVAFAARGMFAIVQLYSDAGEGARVAGEIVHVVNGNDVKSWKKAGEWPKQFDVEAAAPQAPGSDDDDLPDNPNRRRVVAESSSDEESDEE